MISMCRHGRAPKRESFPLLGSWKGIVQIAAYIVANGFSPELPITLVSDMKGHPLKTERPQMPPKGAFEGHFLLQRITQSHFYCSAIYRIITQMWDPLSYFPCTYVQ